MCFHKIFFVDFFWKSTQEFYDQASRSISNGKLKASQPLHTHPINLIVYEGPLGDRSPRDSLFCGQFRT